MIYEVQIDHINFHHNAERGEDGAVWFCILGEPHPGVVCPSHPARKHYYERQAFRRGSFGFRLNATAQEKAENKANVWGWDGNTEAPNITPSYLAHEDRPYRMHSFVEAGKLTLCADSTVVLLRLASPCMLR